jgi:hypothetical protein
MTSKLRLRPPARPSRLLSEGLEEDFVTDIQPAVPMVCPKAAAPPSCASPECVSDRAEQLDVSARPSPHQMAH